MSAPFFIIKTSRITQGEDGKLYNFKRPYLKPLQEIIAFFKDRMLSDLTKAGDGVYTWIYKDTGIMYLSLTRSIQEIGSLHANLDEFSGEGNIVAAGELQRSADTITYNLRSGTYMERVISTRPKRNELVKLIDDFIASRGLVPKFLKCKTDENGNGTEECAEEYELLAGKDLIQDAGIITPQSEIDIYSSMFSNDRKVRGGRAKASTLKKARRNLRKTHVKRKRAKSI